jgi:formate-dependent nitrite reductase membrane component NrfD
VILGNVIPLVLTWRARQGRQFNVVTMATLVLLGGFLLRLVIIFSAQSRLS